MDLSRPVASASCGRRRATLLALPLVRKVLLHRDNLTKVILAQTLAFLLEAIADLPCILELLAQCLLGGGKVLALLREFQELRLARIIWHHLRSIKIRLDSARRIQGDCCVRVAVLLGTAGPVASAAANLLWDRVVTRHPEDAAGGELGSGGGKASGGFAAELELAA